MRRKKVVLRGLLVLIFITLAFPVYYVTDLIITSVILKKLQHKITNSRPKIEYFSFANLESVIKRNINSTKYLIYAFANHTKGSAVLERDDKQNIVIQNTDIMHVYGTIQNQETKDIYNFQAAYLGIAEANAIVKLYKDFYISLQIQAKKSTIEMRGDHLIFNLRDSSILSESPVIFNTEDSILIGGNFSYKDGHARLVKDIFLDTDRAMVVSDEMDIYLTGNTLLTQNSKEVSFGMAVFTGHAKMFDKINNTHVYANIITIDNEKQLATLQGNAKIERQDGTVLGDIMTYKLSQGYAEIRSGTSKKTNERVTVKIKY
jgi:lipopolysaccharide export system protein LptA